MGKPGLLLSKTAPSLPSLTDGPAERAVEFKRQELAVAKLLATIRTIVTRASARSSAEMTVLRNAVQRVARDLGDPSLVAEAEKMEAAWTAVLDLERSLAEQKSEPAMLTAKRSVEVCKQEEAAVVKRILNSQATTRRMESERNAAQTKLATLKTDMEELYRNRVTHLLEVCEEQDEQLDTVQTELNQELERRVALVDTTGAKAERMELENADIETRLAVVYQQAMVLEEEAAQLEAAIKALEVEIGDNKAQRKAVEKGHKEMMKSLSHQELHSVELLAEAEHEAEKIAKTRALEAEKQQEAFEHMVSLLEAAISAAEEEARQGREKIKEAQVAEAKAREKAEGIEARLEEFAELFAQLEEREAKLEDLRGEVQAAKATLAGHKAETKAAEDERDDYLDRKARFCKRRVAVPDSPEEQCAWLVDWVRNLKSKLLELQREKVVCDERSEAA
jgi:DNA repair exonuclease SbcCD ATPase subunit